MTEEEVRKEIEKRSKELDKEINRGLLKDVLIWGSLGIISAIIFWEIV